MNNQFNLEISSNADCNVYNGNDFLFALKAYCSTKISIEKANIKLRVFDIDNQSKLHQIDYDFTSDYYRIFIDLIAIIKARKFIENFKPIVKKEYERGSRSYWEKGRIDKSFQYIYGYDLDCVFATGHNPNSDFEDGYAMVRFRSNDSNEYYGFRTDYKFINKLGNIVSDYIGNNVSGHNGNNIENKADGIAIVFNNNKFGFVNLRDEKIYDCKYDKAFSFKDGLASVSFDGKYGFIDKNENVVIDFIYQEASNFNEELACVKLESKFGYINKNGLEILPFIYDKATSFCNTIAKVIINEKNYIIDRFGNRNETVDFDSIIECKNNVALVKKSERNIFIDQNGKVVFVNLFQSWGKFVNGFLRVTDVNNMHGYINTKGQIVIPLIYEYADDFSDGLACVQRNNKYGFIDKNGTQVIDFIYEYAYGFSEGLACVKHDDKYGFIDKNGTQVIDFIYEYADSFSEGLARVCVDNKYGFINKIGDTVIKHLYDNAGRLSEGLICVNYNDNWSVIDVEDESIFYNRVIHCRNISSESFKDGLLIVTLSGDSCELTFFDFAENINFGDYYNCSDFSEGYACVKVSSDSNYFFIDKNERDVFDRSFTAASSFSEGLACCQNEKYRYGYIDKSGNDKIPFSFQYASDFSEGLASVTINDKYGYIDNSGKEIIPIEFDEIFNFIGEYAKVNINGMYGIIDNKGKLIIPAIYESIKHCAYDFFIVQKKEYYLCKNWGVIDVNDNIILPFGFDEITLLNNNFIKVSIKKKIGLYNHNFEELFLPKYDILTDFRNNLSMVKLNGHWGLIDNKGEEVVSPKYDEISDFVDGIARVKLHNWDFDFIDKNGNNITPKQHYGSLYSDALDFSNGFAAVKNKNSLWGYIDKSGNEVIKCQFEEAMSFSEGLACIKLGDNYGYINNKGDIVIYCCYPEAGDFKNGFALVSYVPKINGKMHRNLINTDDDTYTLNYQPPTKKKYINANGESLIIRSVVDIYQTNFEAEKDILQSIDKITYLIDDATDFYEGYARVKIKGVWRLLDTKGRFY